MRKVIGIDLGGTGINAGLIDEKGNILKKISKNTGSDDGRVKVLERIKEIINTLLENETVEGIGIGSPGFINLETGKVLSVGGNIEGWAGTNIKDELASEFPNIPIFVDNDANVAAICEEWLGAVKGVESFVMITLGTGVGGAIYSKADGIWYGKNYQGGELGHAILYPNGRVCKCGQRGCVEQYISGTAIENTYRELTGKNLKGKEIFINFREDEDCKKTINNFVQDLGNFLISIKNIFDPEAVVIGGGVINSKEHWWNKTIEYYEENSNNLGMKIIPAKFLNNAGMIGAAKVVFDKI